MKLLGFGTKTERDEYAFIEEMIARTGAYEPVDPTPGWALLLRSPYALPDAATSWLGGVPCAPRRFVWPKEADGRPLHFLAQIHLASVRPEPVTGARPPALPAEGALLVFVGRSYACRVLSAAEMRHATPVALPAGIGPVEEHGFFSEKPTFRQWPINLVPFIDRDGGRPPCIPDPFLEPSTWIVNCGMAALEARIVIDCLRRELAAGLRFFENLSKQSNDYKETDFIKKRMKYQEDLARDAPPVLQALQDWCEAIQHRPDVAPIEPGQLDAIWPIRRTLHDRIVENYTPKSLLLGDARHFWEEMKLEYPRMYCEDDFDCIPEYLRPFIEMWVTDWRHHRLFGLEPPFSNNDEDRRGQGCLISIGADELLRTVSEHECGMSIWCNKSRLARGKFNKGQFIRHYTC